MKSMPKVDQIDISLFSNNHGHKHLTFPFVGGSWMYILLMMSQKREIVTLPNKLLLYIMCQTEQRLCLEAQPCKQLHVDQIQDGVQTDLVTKLDFQKESSPSLLTSKTIIGTKKFVCLDSLK